jgi:hypothetical protein
MELEWYRVQLESSVHVFDVLRSAMEMLVRPWWSAVVVR